MQEVRTRPEGPATHSADHAQANGTQGLCPLVVDLDGTLTPTDTLAESVVRAVRRRPANLLRLPLWLLRGRAALKARVADEADFSATHLPLHEPLLAYLREQKASGRQLVLATAAHHSVAGSVSQALGLFDQVLASDAGRNLKGAEKLAAIIERVGPRFAYAGDSACDRPIWAAAEAAIIIGSPRGSRQLRSSGRIEQEFAVERAGPSTWLRALRVHQWLKNLLLFVPLLTSFAFLDPPSVLAAVLGFFAFSCVASATYLVNDLLDLGADRTHPRKRHRPLAAGRIPITTALAVGAGLLCTGLVLAALVNPRFVALLLAYLVLTSAYSWVLKHYVLLDVMMLATLYTLRILAGSVAIGVATSSWLLAFSVFMFFSLALVKRCSELVSLMELSRHKTSGRDYNVTDLLVLWPLGVGAGLCSVVVFGLFISTPDTQLRYASPQLMWLVGLGLMYWLGRLWIKTARGQMHDDPLVFALRDFGSRVTVIAMVAATLAAHFLPAA